MLEVIAQLRDIRISPKKIRLVTDLVKGMNVDDAALQLRFMHKRSAPVVAKLLKSAVANAEHNNQITADKLRIKNIIVNEAVPLKRFKPAAHGAAHPIRKRGSHVRLILSLRPGSTVEAETKGSKKKKSDPVKLEEASVPEAKSAKKATRQERPMKKKSEPKKN